MYKLLIPEITDEELMKRYSRIKPVIRKNGKLYFMEDFSTIEALRNKSYIWDCEEKLASEVLEGGLTRIEESDFECLHAFASPMFFKPTIAEVLSQIDDCYLDAAVAFELMDVKRTDDCFKNSFTNIAAKNHFHVSLIRLYR